MKRLSLFTLCLIAAVFALAACGGTPTPTPTPTEVIEEATQQVDSATAVPLAEIAQTIAIPAPGTLMPGSGVVTPGETYTPLTFDTVQLEIFNSGLGINYAITVYSDGRIVRDDTETFVSRETVSALAGLLEQIDFFDMQGIFTGDGVGSGNRYYLTVSGERGSRTVTADDGITPPELLAIISLVQGFGELSPAPTPPAAEATEAT
jgi:hypothetical protein